MIEAPIRALGVIGCLAGACAAAAAPSIETFAARPRIENVAISPDGRYLSLIETARGRAVLLVVDRHNGGAGSQKFVLAEPEHFRMSWCRWATNTRVLCSFRGTDSRRGVVFPVTRLVGVDADGANMRVLIQNSAAAQGEIQDRVLNWRPGPPDTVLVEADEGVATSNPSVVSTWGVVIGNIGTHGLPAIFELNVTTGRMSVRERAWNPIRHWVTDQRGRARLGWGVDGANISYYARLDGEHDWRRLSRFEAFSRENHFKPLAISAEDPNKAYAIADAEGRAAVWLVDLTDKTDPVLVFAHPAVDVSVPIMASDGRLLGLRYETDYPMAYYTDEGARRVAEGLKRAVPGQFCGATDSAREVGVEVIRCFSDVDPPRYRVIDTASGVFDRLPAPYPDLDAASLATMQPISYPARDGTSIPGYLSVPRAGAGSRLPLILMPHGGPIDRDTWGYFFLRQFLVSRGYAVLQMNFRGSNGYGSEWFFAAHQDWGGLTYDDVVDGARWAIKQGIADPGRVCIVGWSFGGYLALIGAQRNGDLFRCAVSIAGISDLSLLVEERYDSPIVRRQIGMDSAKLNRDSPRLHAAEFAVPLLMLHGERDTQSPFEQSKAMDAALSRAGKAHRFVVIPDGDHQFSSEAHRATMLREVEAFLEAQLVTSAGRP